MPSRLDRTVAIDAVEACYDLGSPAAAWLPRLAQSMSKVVDRELELIAMRIAGLSESAGPLTFQLHVIGDPSLTDKLIAANQEMGPALVAQTHLEMAGRVFAISELAGRFPESLRCYRRRIECEDVLIMSAVDPDFHGTALVFVSNQGFDHTRARRSLLEKLAIHVTAGSRLRSAIDETEAAEGSAVGLYDVRSPEQYEAIIDPKHFRVAEADGAARTREALERLRISARRVDRARGRLRRTDPDQALEIWQGLVRGRWSLVDWFDSDGRRFLLARPNTPDLGDPRGLTDSELQVATYAARGESGKLVAYRLGFSSGQVSALLKSAMRKLGAKTQAQLVERMRTMPRDPGSSRQ